MDNELNEFEKYIEILIKESVAEDKITNFLIQIHAKNLLHILDKQRESEINIAEQFEYKRVFYKYGFKMSDLNNEGKNGWELCNIEKQCDASCYVIYKRKLSYDT